MRHAKFYSLLAVGAAMFVPSMANAQVAFESETVSVTEFTCDNQDHHFAGWRDNWFIQIGAGANTPMVETGIGYKTGIKEFDTNRITATYNFGFGRWISPYLGIRINAIGGSLHWDNPVATNFNEATNTVEFSRGWSHAKHVNLNAELMWDMFNTFAGANPKRVFSIIPFVGLGGDFTWNMNDGLGNPPAGSNVLEVADIFVPETPYKSNTWTLPVTAGIQFRFRLCKAVDFFAEARASFYGDNWNNCAYDRPIEANVAAIGGFSFNINGRGWNTYNECAYVSQIADLNNQVNDLRGTVLNQQQAIAALEAQLPCPEAKVVEKPTAVANQAAPMLTNVRFKINSYKITPQEEVNVYNVAEWMKANPSEKIIVCGYADKDTGTAAYNLALSEKRANAVADQLVNKYGIERSRLTVKFDGSDVQPYPTQNDWNRIVIFTQK